MREIRRLWETGDYTLSALGEMFSGIAFFTVHDIVARRSWKNIHQKRTVQVREAPSYPKPRRTVAVRAV
ncbi:MAG: hypothetical protein ACRDRJ_05135 [Streptosporangiaceae bacterium]